MLVDSALVILIDGSNLFYSESDMTIKLSILTTENAMDRRVIHMATSGALE